VLFRSEGGSLLFQEQQANQAPQIICFNTKLVTMMMAVQ